MSSADSRQVERGAKFAVRALLTVASLVAWDSSSPQIASASTERPLAACEDAAEGSAAEANGSEPRALARPRRYQPCNRPPPSNRAPQQRRCSDRAFNLLYAQVHKYCHLRERKCSPQADACEIIDKKVRSGYGCTDAREVLQQQCYRAGDPGYTNHMDEISKAYGSLRRCIDIQDDKCAR